MNTAAVPFDVVREAASDRVRGLATDQQVRLLDADLDRWAAALRRLIADVDGQIERRELRRREREAAGDQYVDGEYEWQGRARRFQEHVREVLADVDSRRAALAHQQLRQLLAGARHDLEDVVVDAHLRRQLFGLLDALDDVDPLPVAV